ncbi:hypothetical protein [Natrinema sp. DC36]|nr:hypothetical protein [Natrinema sp. DC36]
MNEEDKNDAQRQLDSAVMAFSNDDEEYGMFNIGRAYEKLN